MTPPLDVRFAIEGQPLYKGNHSAFPISRGRCKTCKRGKCCGARNCFGGIIVGTVVTDKGGAALEAWQELAGVRAASARNAAGQRMVQRPGALEVTMIFVLPRPDGHWTPSGALTAAGRAQPLPTVKPDFDKLVRACSDGISGSVIEDDAQVIVAPIAKIYAGWRGWIGAAVRARQVSSYPDWVKQELSYHGVWSTTLDDVQGALL